MFFYYVNRKKGNFGICAEQIIHFECSREIGHVNTYVHLNSKTQKKKTKSLRILIRKID